MCLWRCGNSPRAHTQHTKNKRQNILFSCYEMLLREWAWQYRYYIEHSPLLPAAGAGVVVVQRKSQSDSMSTSEFCRLQMNFLVWLLCTFVNVISRCYSCFANIVGWNEHCYERMYVHCTQQGGSSSDVWPSHYHWERELQSFDAQSMERSGKVSANFTRNSRLIEQCAHSHTQTHTHGQSQSNNVVQHNELKKNEEKKS